jgi:deoxycytidylate deaminase
VSRRYEVVAYAYNKKGRLLSVGKNSYTKTHPLQAKFAKIAGKEAAIYLHAELDALIKATEQVHTLIVERSDKDGKPANSRPCPSCQEAIKHFKVQEVFYT